MRTKAHNFLDQINLNEICITPLLIARKCARRNLNHGYFTLKQNKKQQYEKNKTQKQHIFNRHESRSHNKEMKKPSSEKPSFSIKRSNSLYDMNQYRKPWPQNETCNPIYKEWIVFLCS